MPKKKAGAAKKRLDKKEMKKTKGGFGVIIDKRQITGGFIGSNGNCVPNSVGYCT